ncbi:transcriptional repressor [Sulfurihydrogenibium sp.]|uniref:Fur family transcriptional regulator n=1 Tax=Sulfurihydrogenibium sp. TaxID=2053621 RepID=UPI00261A4DCD|nr:transcriptional repressor [Sulfurihydrogenibium sp.]
MQRRNTNQRKIIYEIIKSTDIHPTADWIYEKAKMYIPNISLGTVYRNLKVLQEEGLILEITDGRQSRFDARTDRHYHFKCIKCDSIYDIDLDMLHISADLKHLTKKGFKINQINIDMEGICPKCSKGVNLEKNN